MLDAIASLLREGHEVEWHVYGDGPQPEELAETVKQRKLEGQVESCTVPCHTRSSNPFLPMPSCSWALEPH